MVFDCWKINVKDFIDVNYSSVWEGLLVLILHKYLQAYIKVGFCWNTCSKYKLLLDQNGRKWSLISTVGWEDQSSFGNQNQTWEFLPSLSVYRCSIYETNFLVTVQSKMRSLTNGSCHGYYANKTQFCFLSISYSVSLFLQPSCLRVIDEK